MLDGRLPSRIEASAVRRKFYSTEVVKTDGGNGTYNGRWTTPQFEWDCTVPLVGRTSADYLATDGLFDDAKGSLDTFLFHDPVDCADVEVRFKDDTLTVTGVGNLVTVTFTLEKAR